MSPRILFLGSGLHGVSCRFRIFQYLPYLRERAIDADVADLRSPLLQRWRILRSAAGYDAVVVHRAFLNPLEHRWLRASALHYVFDFDDAIMFRDSSHRRFDSRARRQCFERMVAGARSVVAGNAYLAALAAPYNQQVTIIPTPIDLSVYPTRRARLATEPILGWIGTHSNLMYLCTIAPALRRLRQMRSAVKLKMVSDGFVDLPGIEVITKRWSLADEVDDLMSFQVGLMPLPDDPWTRGKCALKILQYFAAAVPTVCSPVGTNLDIVEHGANGYFAATENEWLERLHELLADADKRRRFGDAGRQIVERRYSIHSAVEQLLGVLV